MHNSTKIHFGSRKANFTGPESNIYEFVINFKLNLTLWLLNYGYFMVINLIQMTAYLNIYGAIGKQPFPRQNV